MNFTGESCEFYDHAGKTLLWETFLKRHIVYNRLAAFVSIENLSEFSEAQKSGCAHVQSTYWCAFFLPQWHGSLFLLQIINGCARVWGPFKSVCSAGHQPVLCQKSLATGLDVGKEMQGVQSENRIQVPEPLLLCFCCRLIILSCSLFYTVGFCLIKKNKIHLVQC